MAAAPSKAKVCFTASRTNAKDPKTCIRDSHSRPPATGGVGGLGGRSLGQVHREDVALEAQVVERQPAHPQLVYVPILPMRAVIYSGLVRFMRP